MAGSVASDLGSRRFENTLQPGSRCTLIIPTYNASSFIDDTVVSLSAFVMRHADWEVLFVCDGCSDDTVERLTRAIGKQARLAERLRVVSYPLNRGKGFAVRRGLDLARGEYRVFKI